MSVGAKLITAEDLSRLPDEGNRYELVEGELRTMSPSSGRHGMLAGRIAAHLGSYVRAAGLGEVVVAEAGFLLRKDPDTVRCPDVGFVAKGRAIEDAFITGAPDLAIEVISPSDAYSDVITKVRDYLGAGCRMVILIDPRRQSATVHTSDTTVHLSAADAIDGDAVIPGWKLPLRELFV
ncbi:MAG TPA: Uma2 family endonuclease [Thermoanaerobaculia bacterium]|nr:Uma2 family endonuclease [Thermoanaerobaculia bacterium]